MAPVVAELLRGAAEACPPGVDPASLPGPAVGGVPMQASVVICGGACMSAFITALFSAQCTPRGAARARAGKPAGAGVICRCVQASVTCEYSVSSLPARRQSISQVLTKEVVYRAAALGAYELHEYVDFTAWLRSSLLPEVSGRHPALAPLRRAAAELVAANVARLESDDRPAAYAALVALMAEDDVCLQVGGAFVSHE